MRDLKMLNQGEHVIIELTRESDYYLSGYTGMGHAVFAGCPCFLKMPDSPDCRFPPLGGREGGFELDLSAHLDITNWRSNDD
jgi:hypothetical protein